MNTAQRKFLAHVLDSYPGEFSRAFPLWMEDNFHVWQRFARECDLLRECGRDHYSARTVIEVLRHETQLRECGSDYKISNDFIPDLARLYQFTRHCDGFFTLKERAA